MVSQCSKEDIGSKLRRRIEDVPAVHISNPKTLEFQVMFRWPLCCSADIQLGHVKLYIKIFAKEMN